MEVCSNGHGVAETGCVSCDISVLEPVLLNCAVCLTVIVGICGSKLKWLKNIAVCTIVKQKLGLIKNFEMWESAKKLGIQIRHDVKNNKVKFMQFVISCNSIDVPCLHTRKWMLPFCTGSTRNKHKKHKCLLAYVHRKQSFFFLKLCD